MTECICGVVYIGHSRTENRNWHPDCYQHGIGSDWYNSPEQAQRRIRQRQRLRAVQNEARKARGLEPLPDPDQAEAEVPRGERGQTGEEQGRREQREEGEG